MSSLGKHENCFMQPVHRQNIELKQFLKSKMWPFVLPSQLCITQGDQLFDKKFITLWSMKMARCHKYWQLSLYNKPERAPIMPDCKDLLGSSLIAKAGFL